MIARIDTKIRLDASLHPTLRRRIIGELSLRNPDKDRAVAEMTRDALELPDELALWSADGNDLVLPRGYAHRLEALAQGFGEEIAWESSMTLLPPSKHLYRSWRPAPLRDYQLPARDAMLEWAQGLLKMPTGGGKTRSVYETARWAGQRTMILVHTTALARQWEEVARDVYGFSPGFIGEGQWDERELTIAMRQTLWEKRTDIDPSWWSMWGMLVVDEAHHTSAATLAELVGYFPAFYRLGVSATPEWDRELFPIVEAVIGPVIHETSREAVGDHLHTPRVRLVETSFDFDYVPTHKVGHKRVQNNYTEMMAALVEDEARNHLIYRTVRTEVEAGHHVLIVTRRREHVKKLVNLLGDDYRLGRRLHVLTGSQTGHDAQRIAKVIAGSGDGTILISTVADEALDIPRLDRLVMAFPLRRIPLVEQQVGRILRRFDGKLDAEVIDIVDARQDVLKTQCRDRRQFYMRRGWQMTKEEE